LDDFRHVFSIEGQGRSELAICAGYASGLKISTEERLSFSHGSSKQSDPIGSREKSRKSWDHRRRWQQGVSGPNGHPEFSAAVARTRWR
jgi:hypothetical protein